MTNKFTTSKVFSTLSLLFFTAAVLCWVAFAMIGSSVDDQGFLHEPFFLIPIGWLMLFLAGISTVINSITKFVQKRSVT